MSKKKLLIIGAGGHGRVVADIAGCTGEYEEIAFLDDAPPALAPYPVLGGVSDFASYTDEYEFCVAVGNAAARERLTVSLERAGARLAVLIHPDATVSDRAVIGAGTVVMAGAVVCTFATVGKGVIINTCSSVDHDCEVADFCHVSVGAHLCGTVRVGRGTWIGAGATVINNIDIVGDCMIGAGAVVVGNIDDAGTYVGVPARRIK